MFYIQAHGTPRPMYTNLKLFNRNKIKFLSKLIFQIKMKESKNCECNVPASVPSCFRIFKWFYLVYLFQDYKIYKISI